MEDDAHQPNEPKSQRRLMKTYMKARYRLSNLLRVQRSDRMKSSLKMWFENGAPEGQFPDLKKTLVAERWVVVSEQGWDCRLQKEGRGKGSVQINAIVLPQLYKTELYFRSHYQMGHQGIDKLSQRTLKWFEKPEMKKACEKWVTACLSCQRVKTLRKLKLPLKSTESSDFNDAVQVDRQKICTIDSGYNQVLLMIGNLVVTTSLKR